MAVNLPKAVKPVRGGAEIETQVVWLLWPCICTYWKAKQTFDIRSQEISGDKLDEKNYH